MITTWYMLPTKIDSTIRMMQSWEDILSQHHISPRWGVRALNIFKTTPEKNNKNKNDCIVHDTKYIENKNSLSKGFIYIGQGMNIFRTLKYLIESRRY
jgi:hypothetical protein